MKLFPKLLLALLMVPVASAAHAEQHARLDLPAGRLSKAMAALGAQAGVSVSVSDAGLWRQRVPAVKGSMSVREALARMLAGTDARFDPIDGRSWRITRAARERPSPLPPRPPAEVAAPPAATDIIVTASKRDIRLGDYPGTVALLDGADLAFGGEGGTDAIASRLASVSSTHLGAGRNKLFIRGIADSSFTGPTQATVGQYFGDVRLTYNAPDPDLRLYDIASVEVLEGPHGTLYGAGSLGGIIRIVRNPPVLDATEGALSAGAAATAHGDPGADAGGMVNLPLLSERIALRLVGYGVTEGGYIDNLATGRDDINRTRIAGGRATLRVVPGADWTIDLGGAIQDTDGADSQYADRDGPPLTRASQIEQGFDSRYRFADLVIGKQWGDIRLLSSTGFVWQDLAERYDATLPGGPPRLFQQQNRTRLFSIENRLSRTMHDGLGWIVGTSFIHNSTRLDRALGAPGDPLPVTGVTNRISEFTVYGEASVALMPGLTATGGGRLTHSRLSGEGEDVAREVLLANVRFRADRNETALLPSFAISANLLPRLILFARYEEGFRPGGLAIEAAFVRRFHSDSVATLETGARYGAPGRDGFDIAATFAYTRWNDIQADFIDGVGLPTTANIGDGRIYSFAATAGWRPLPGLGLDAALVFNDSRVTDPAPALFIDRMSRLPNVAKFSARAGIDYRATIGDDLDLRLGASARYIGRSRLGIGPVLGEAQGDYVDTAATARIGKGALGLSLGVTNLFDSIGNRFALGTPFTTAQNEQITPLRPRTIRIGIDAHF